MEEKHSVFLVFLLLTEEESKPFKYGTAFVKRVHRPIQNILVDPSQAKQLLFYYRISSLAS